LDTILMWLLDLVIKQFWLVVLDFNTNSANLYLVLHNVGVNIERCDDSWASAESNLVTLDLWPWCFTLDVNTCSLTWHNDVFRNYHIIFWLLINHNSPGIKMCKRTFMDCCITFQGQNTSGIRTSSLIIFIVL
jgi:hypothetical protein